MSPGRGRDAAGTDPLRPEPPASPQADACGNDPGRRTATAERRRPEQIRKAPGDPISVRLFIRPRAIELGPRCGPGGVGVGVGGSGWRGRRGGGWLTRATGLGPRLPEDGVSVAAPACVGGTGFLRVPPLWLPTEVPASRAHPGKPARLGRNQSHLWGGGQGRPRPAPRDRWQGHAGRKLCLGAACRASRSAPGSHCAPGSGGLVSGGCPVRAPWGPHQLLAAPRPSSPASESRYPAKRPSLTAYCLLWLGKGLPRC